MYFNTFTALVEHVASMGASSRLFNASLNCRSRRAIFVLWSAVALRRLPVFCVLAALGAAALRLRALVGLLLALERRLIAFPKAQDKASCRFKLAHWKRPGAVLRVTANFDRECPLWVISGHRGTIGTQSGNVRFVPKADILSCNIEAFIRPCRRAAGMRRRAHSTVTPLALMGPLQRTISSATNLRKYSGLRC